MCGAPVQEMAGLENVDLDTVTVIQGRVLRAGSPAPASYVRLLDGTGEFTAEVQTSAEGHFRFFAAPGDWIVRVLLRGGAVEERVGVDRGVTEVELTLP